MALFEAFELDDWSGKYSIGEYPKELAHALHLLREVCDFLETFRYVLIQHKWHLDYTPQELHISEALDHAKLSYEFLRSLSKYAGYTELA